MWPATLTAMIDGVGADIGVVGRDQEAPLDKPVVAPIGAVAEGGQGDERQDEAPRRARAAGGGGRAPPAGGSAELRPIGAICPGSRIGASTAGSRDGARASGAVWAWSCDMGCAPKF